MQPPPSKTNENSDLKNRTSFNVIDTLHQSTANPPPFRSSLSSPIRTNNNNNNSQQPSSLPNQNIHLPYSRSLYMQNSIKNHMTTNPSQPKIGSCQQQ
jgi:hypothetical protein